MNSGLLTYATRGRAFSTVGTHQKFDRAALRLIAPYVRAGSFPTRKQVLNFEGMGGPDGLKFKGPYKADHQWDPINQIGYLPLWIESHYKNLVLSLRKGDMVEASFHAGWLAHYLTDSLTPAHHTSNKLIAAEYEGASKTRRRWLWWGKRGLMTNHVAFELGVSTTMVVSPLRIKFDPRLVESLAERGVVEVMKDESRVIAELNLYDRFIREGWTTPLAKTVRSVVVVRIPQLIAAAWLAAYQESHQPPTAKKSHQSYKQRA